MGNKPWLVALFVLAISGSAQAEMKVETTRIARGVDAWYVESNAVPIVDVLLNFEGAGSASDPAGKGGRAAFSAALLNEGAGEMTAQQFAEALDNEVISLSINSSADQLNIRVRCLRENAKRAGELLALALGQPTLAEAPQAQVKAQLHSLIAQLEENPNYQAQQLLTARAFKNHPYANPPYGTRESIAALSAQDVRDYLNLYVTRGNVRVSAAGDVDAGLLKEMLTPVVEALPANDTGAVAVTQTSPQGGGETLTQVTQLPQTVITFVAPGIARSDKRFYAAYLLNHVLGGGSLSSRLGQALRQKSGMAYSVDTDLDVRRGVSLFSGALSTRNATAETALKDLKAVLQDVRDKGVTSDECNDAKSYVLGSFPLQLDRTSTISSMLFSMQLYGLGEDYLAKRAGYFKNVSCADINAVAHDLLAPEKLLYAIVGGTTKDTPAAPEAAIRTHDAR